MFIKNALILYIYKMLFYIGKLLLIPHFKEISKILFTICHFTIELMNEISVSCFGYY